MGQIWGLMPALKTSSTVILGKTFKHFMSLFPQLSESGSLKALKTNKQTKNYKCYDSKCKSHHRPKSLRRPRKKNTHIIPRFPNLCVNFSGIKVEIMIFYISSMTIWDWILYFPYLWIWPWILLFCIAY